MSGPRYETFSNPTTDAVAEQLDATMQEYGGTDGLILVTVSQVDSGHSVRARIKCEDTDCARAGIVSLLIEHLRQSTSGDIEQVRELSMLMSQTLTLLKVRREILEN